MSTVTTLPLALLTWCVKRWAHFSVLLYAVCVTGSPCSTSCHGVPMQCQLSRVPMQCQLSKSSLRLLQVLLGLLLLVILCAVDHLTPQGSHCVSSLTLQVKQPTLDNLLNVAARLMALASLSEDSAEGLCGYLSYSCYSKAQIAHIPLPCRSSRLLWQLAKSGS